MNKVYITVIAALVAMCFALGFWLDMDRKALAQQEVVNKSLTEALVRAAERQKLDRQVLVARQQKLASTARQFAESEAALSEALQRNKAWSDTDVPTEVQEGLARHSGGPAARL